MKKLKYLIILMFSILIITSCGEITQPCNHVKSDWIIDKEATCIVEGKQHIECTLCHKTLENDTIKKLDHKLEDIIEHEDPTCISEGYDKGTCTNCHEEIKVNIKALGHDLIHHEGLGATCTKPGYKAYDTCSRCNYTTYEEIPATGHNYVAGVCTKCGEKNDKPEYIIDGDYIYFGEYPQTLKEESVTIISTTPDSNGYYLGSDNERYAKVNAKPYSSTYYFNNNQQIVDGTTYYFKVEPIKWRILQVNGTEYKLVTDLIIDNQMFYSSTDTRTIDGKTIYANNYEHSDIRKWLNEDFYNKAFTKALQSCINTTLVDNSIESTGFTSNKYICNDTYDKVYLLSCKDVTNEEYGFTDYTSREKQLTDYAKAKGCYMNTSDSYYNNGNYWLRSPYYYYGIYARYVDLCGSIDDSRVYLDDAGVSAAITISLS